MTHEATFWNDLAERYAQKPVEDPGAFEAKIAITKSRMKPTDVVLDIGCGTGSLALRLAPSAVHVHGLDLSSEMIRIAKSKAEAQKIENVTFHTGPFDDTFTASEDEVRRAGFIDLSQPDVGAKPTIAFIVATKPR